MAGEKSISKGMKKPIRLGVLASGSGRTLQNLIDRIEDGSLPARIEVVISSHPNVKGLDRARKANIPAVTVNWKSFTEKTFSEAVTAELDKVPLDLVVMAGFIRRYLFPKKYEGRILNIHPALLPKFGGKGYYGHAVHEAVLKSDSKESGCTVHYVDLQYDHGPTHPQKRR